MLSNQDNYNYYTKYIGLLVEHETMKTNYEKLKGVINYNSGEQQRLGQEIELLKQQNKEISQAFSRMATNEHQTAIKYESITKGQESLVEQLELARDRHQRLVDQLIAVKGRTDNTTTSNLTAEKRAIFFEMFDIWYQTIEWE